MPASLFQIVVVLILGLGLGGTLSSNTRAHRLVSELRAAREMSNL